jgi:hypothetical protein
MCSWRYKLFEQKALDAFYSTLITGIISADVNSGIYNQFIIGGSDDYPNVSQKFSTVFGPTSVGSIYGRVCCLAF